MTLQKDLDKLDTAFKDFKAQTIDKFGAWYFRFFGPFAFPIYVILLLITMAYVLTSFYYTLND